MAQANGRKSRLEEAMANLARSQEALTQAQANLVQSHATLAQAQATLIQNQAVFLARAAETDAYLKALERNTSERFARIEALLLEHNRILQALPDAVREKIGFKVPAPPPPAS